MEKNSLLEEALKRHKMITEYKFYVPMAEDEVHEGIGLEEQEEEPAGEEFDLEGLPGGEELPDVEPLAGEEELPDVEPLAGEVPIEEPIDDITAEPTGDAIDVDVTALVDKAEEAKEEVMGAVATQMEDLLGKLSDLESKVGGMDQVISKIASLESEMKERIPTPKEQLELRSLDSYPYNVKLTDFWKDRGMMGDEEEEPTEYTLTDEDVKSDGNQIMMKLIYKIVLVKRITTHLYFHQRRNQ